MVDEPDNIMGIMLRELRDEIHEVRGEVRDLGGLRDEVREIRDDIRGMRRELQDVRILSLGTFDRVKRLDRRVEETRDDLETTIKAEIMGTGMNWRRELESRIEALEDGMKQSHP